MTKSDYEKIIKLLSPKSKIIITSHHNPDGDAVGSAMAMYHTLKNLNIDLKVVLPNKFPEFLQWIPDTDQVYLYEEHEEEFMKGLFDAADLIFCLDYNAPSRVAKMEKVLRDAPGIKVLIDHHPNPELEAFDFALSKVSASSTAELVYEFLSQIGLTHHVNKAAAESLYTGIVTDTGSFSFSCNNPETYRITADLIEKGVDAVRVHRLIYDTFSEDRLRLLGYAFNSKLLSFPEYHTAIISLSKEELSRFNGKSGDTEGIVNYPLSIKEINVSILLTERDDLIRLSFRSKGDFEVNRIARDYFEGGGHKNAAGGNSYLSMEATIQKIREILPLYQRELDYIIE